MPSLISAPASSRGSSHIPVKSGNSYALRNVLVASEHHVGLEVDTQVLVAIDTWEHAYFIDYGTNKAEYVRAVLSAIDWRVVAARLKDTPVV